GRRRARAPRQRPSAPVRAGLGRRSFLRQRLGRQRAVELFHESLDAQLGTVQLSAYVAQVRDALLEQAERLVELEVIALQPGDDLLEARNTLLELEVGGRLSHAATPAAR